MISEHEKPIGDITKAVLNLLKEQVDSGNKDPQDAIIALAGVIGSIIGQFGEQRAHEYLGLAIFCIYTTYMLSNGYDLLTNEEREEQKNAA